jgi:hypothetical protein
MLTNNLRKYDAEAALELFNTPLTLFNNARIKNILWLRFT